jgi:CheY-like chemotaxis protein
MSGSPVETVAVLLPDLFFAPRFADLIRAQGGDPVIIESAEALLEAVDAHDPVLVIVDLSAPGDWENAMRRIKLRPHTRQTPLYAFGSHTEAETLRRARAAGADHVWARSKMMQELPSLIESHLNPAVIYPEGWDAPLADAARRGVEEFNHRRFHEQHEWFEKAWIEEKRPIREMFQGILQVGLAFYQIEQGNWTGTLKMFRRGLPRLRALPPVCQGIDVAALRSAAQAIHAEVTALGPQRLGEFDQDKFPQIAVAGDPQGAL